MSEIEKFTFQVDVNRIIEVLARQIYQSPLALLRENAQNAFDAIMLKKSKESSLLGVIDVSISQTMIRISDNGIGMTKEDLKEHFWKAGSSSKNTPEARAAGVVGTFGIGAMANFGVASKLEVETEINGIRYYSVAERKDLSTTVDCILVQERPCTGESGTIVTASIMPEYALNVPQAIEYLQEFVSYSNIEILCNGEKISQVKMSDSIPQLKAAWELNEASCPISNSIRADVFLQGAMNGETRISLANIKYNNAAMIGEIVLRQGMSSIKTFRNGFGLATVGVVSAFSFGGSIDLLVLQPTAGREALSTESIQFIQGIIKDIDNFAGNAISNYSECNMNTNFMSWAINKQRFDLMGKIKITCLSDSCSSDLDLNDVANSTSDWKYYKGNDDTIIKAYTAEGCKLLQIAQTNPRRQCQLGFLKSCKNVSEISDTPSVLEIKDKGDFSAEESAVVFKLTTILEFDYFLITQILLGTISHNLPLFVDRTKKPLEIIMDPSSSGMSTLINIYKNEYSAFSGMAKDYVRSIVFPQISDLVPSSTRQGAEAFLRSIRRQKEYFEVDSSEMIGLTEIWELYLTGDIDMKEAANRSTAYIQSSVQKIDNSGIQSVSSVVPDVVSNDEQIHQAPIDESLKYEAIPPIIRQEVESEAKLLTIKDNELPLQGFKCFIAITDKTKDDYGEFFVQPHRTSIVWGGQKAIFIFQHHSNRFGLYYDMQLPHPLSDNSGGGPFATCTLILKNRIYIPIPYDIQPVFIPGAGETKKFEVRCDVIYAED